MKLTIDDLVMYACLVIIAGYIYSFAVIAA